MLSPEEAQRQAVAVARMSVTFAQLVSVLMRSPLHKHFSIADLEWLVLPPLLAGQCRVVEAKAHANGPGVPVAIALWASVSSDVDKRLSENLNAPMRLRPDEWKSGEVLWLVDAVGDRRVVLPLLKQLDESTFKDKEVKLRARSQDGKLILRTLRAELASAPTPSQ
jgi:cytolysin-activating lysine-acyltransferase